MVYIFGEGGMLLGVDLPPKVSTVFCTRLQNSMILDLKMPIRRTRIKLIRYIIHSQQGNMEEFSR